LGCLLKIELYLRNINQDTIDNPPKGKPGDWRVVVPIWKVNFAIPLAGKRELRYLIREEKEGGMLFDQKTSAVYKLDEEAYHTLIEMEHFKDPEKLAHKLNIEKEKVEELKNRLKELGIT
jgi:hypothetical protein